MDVLYGLLGLGALIGGWTAIGATWSWWKTRKQLRFIQGYEFPRALVDKLREHHPQLGVADADRVLEGLRQWFVASANRKGNEMIGMPSRVVDDAWHEFILMTRLYHQFCDRAFGRYLHHTPNAVAPKPVVDAVPRTLELLDQRMPRSDGSLPALFTLDSELGIPRGRTWQRAGSSGGAIVLAAGVDTGGDCFPAGDAGGDGCGGDGCGGCGSCG